MWLGKGFDHNTRHGVFQGKAVLLSSILQGNWKGDGCRRGPLGCVVGLLIATMTKDRERGKGCRVSHMKQFSLERMVSSKMLIMPLLRSPGR